MTATQTDLLQKNFDPFLRFGTWSEIKHVIPSYKRFRCNDRSKGLAVSSDGKVLRLVISNSGYNDHFHMQGGALIITYVSGIAEETRRLQKLKQGDAVRVTLDQKAKVDADGRLLPERHGVLHGRFQCIQKHIDRKGDDEFLVPHAVVEILGYETAADEIVYFSGSDPVYLPSPVKGNITTLHMILDTESASPSGSWRQSAGFPVLEVAYRIVSYDFQEEFTSYRSFVRYPEDKTHHLGNDASSVVLKFDPRVLLHGENVHDILGRIYAQFRRVHDSGGAIIGHNIFHDIRQLQATAKLVEFQADSFPLNVFDTVRSASSFVANAEVRWMKLHELARCCDISWDTSDATRGQHRAAGDVEVLHKILRRAFNVSHLREFYEIVDITF